MILMRQKKTSEIPLDMTDEVLDKIEKDKYLGKIKPVRKKTWQIRNLSIGIRGLRKKNNDNDKSE